MNNYRIPLYNRAYLTYVSPVICIITLFTKNKSALNLLRWIYVNIKSMLRYVKYLWKCILYCKYGDVDAGGWYTERSASQNGMLLTDYFEAVFVKNNSRQGMNFRWKFNHFMRFRAFRSDIFLTLRLLQNNLEAYPFCSELRLSVYQPPASAISP